MQFITPKIKDQIYTLTFNRTHQHAKSTLREEERWNGGGTNRETFCKDVKPKVQKKEEEEDNKLICNLIKR